MRTSEQTAVVVKEQSALAAYGNREDLSEITDRLMALHPSAKDVGVTGMRAVAQLALMRGANPLPTAGEIYVWQDRGQTVMDIGIAYYRRIANKRDTVLWIIEPRLMTDEERAQHRIPDGDIGAICQGSLLSSVRELVSCGIDFQDARVAVTRTATAIVEHSDQFYSYGDKKGKPRHAPHGRTWHWVAEKRAEKAFYKMMSLVDDSLTQRIDIVNEVREQVGDAFSRYEARAEYTVEDGNRDFFPDSVDDDVYIVGKVIDHELEPEPTTDDDPRGDESPHAQAVRKSLIDNGIELQDDVERTIAYCRDAACFFDTVLANVERYDHENAVKNALRLIGYSGINLSSNQAALRVEMYRSIRTYASFRDAGMNQERTLQAMTDGLFGDEEE